MSAVLDEVITTAQLVPLSQAVEVNPKLDRSLLADDLDVSFVPMASVETLTGGIDVSTIRKYAEVKKGYTHFREGDVLFAKVTPCMENGKMAIARKLVNGVGFGSTEFHVLRPRANVDARYIYYFVSSQTFRKEAAGHMTGAVGLRRVPSAFLEDCEIPLPHIDEQRRIVVELEKQFSRLDEAVANLKRVKANLKRYKASVLKDAVEGRLVKPDVFSEAAGATPLVRLCDAVLFNPKIDRSSLTNETLVSFVPMASVGAANGQIDVSQERNYLEVKKGYTYFREGDVLFAKVTPCMENGKMAVVKCLKNGVGFGSTEFHVLRPRAGVDAQYVYYFVSSEAFRKEAARHMTGAVGLRRVPTAFLESVEIPLPHIDKQRRIVDEVERRFSLVRGAETEVEANLKRSQALRQSTLSKAFATNH